MNTAPAAVKSMNDIHVILWRGRLYMLLLLPFYGALFTLLYFTLMVLFTPVTWDGLLSYAPSTMDWIVRTVILLPPAWMVAKMHGYRLAGVHKLPHIGMLKRISGLTKVDWSAYFVLVMFNAIFWTLSFLLIAWIGDDPQTPDWGYDVFNWIFALFNAAFAGLDERPDEGRSLNQDIDGVMEKEDWEWLKRYSPAYDSYAGNSWYTCLK